VSRSRKPPRVSFASMPFSSAVVCTDRGQHPQALIARFADVHRRGDDWRIVWRQTPGQDLVTDAERVGGSRTFRFRCVRCRRDVQLREPNVVATIDALRQAGADRQHLALDISLLA